METRLIVAYSLLLLMAFAAGALFIYFTRGRRASSRRYRAVRRERTERQVEAARVASEA